MNLVMCCTPVGREDRYHSELRYALLTSIFFKKFYPDSNVYVLTTSDAIIPEKYTNIFTPVYFEFRKYPFAIARQMAYKAFIESAVFKDNTFFVGCDVLFCSEAKLVVESLSLVMTYRYHLTQPYCSDFFYVPLDKKNSAIDFLSNFIEKMHWMPLESQATWADQICLALTVGHLKYENFDGRIQLSPNIEDMLLYPGDDFLFTPNDYFSSVKSDNAGEQIKDCTTSQDLINLLDKKHLIHFKGGGGRKDLMYIFAKICELTGFITIDYNQIGIEREELFKIN